MGQHLTHNSVLLLLLLLLLLRILTTFQTFCILCLEFRASLIYINNCPTRWNITQSIYYSASSLYMFRVSNSPIITSTRKCNYSLQYWSHFCTATSLQRGHAWPRWREVVAPVPEAVVTVLCTPEDGCGWHRKYVEWTCRIINRLLCVASRWTIVNIDLDVFTTKLKLRHYYDKMHFYHYKCTILCQVLNTGVTP